jgi:hypothetical protein
MLRFEDLVFRLYLTEGPHKPGLVEAGNQLTTQIRFRGRPSIRINVDERLHVAEMIECDQFRSAISKRSWLKRPLLF